MAAFILAAMVSRIFLDDCNEDLELVRRRLDLGDGEPEYACEGREVWSGLEGSKTG